jgi:phytoene dehydrogenase-like protein
LLGSKLLTPREKWQFVKLLTSLKRLDARSLDHVSLVDWIESTVSAGNLAALLGALFRVATYGHQPDRMSAGAAIDQLKLAVAGNVWYLDGGWQTLVDGLRDLAAAHGAEVRTSDRVKTVRQDGNTVAVELGNGALIQARSAILAVPPRVACDLLEVRPDAKLARWEVNRLPVRAACLDVGLSRLPRPGDRFALGLDAPVYYSVHSAAAQLAPTGVAVVHIMKYVGNDVATPAESVESELEGILDRLQPGWRDCVLERRYMPNMMVAPALPRADEGGLSGRPDVTLPDCPNTFLAGDWVGTTGLLADAALASAERAAAHALRALERTPEAASWSLLHVAS